MLKPNANFKLSKSSKRAIAACADPVKANQIKKLMIQAELSEAIQPRVSRGKRESQGE